MKGCKKMNTRVSSMKGKFKGCCIAGVLIVTALSITSCGGANNNSGDGTTPPEQTQTAPVTLDVKDVATTILNQGKFSDQLGELDPDMFEVIYQDVDMTKVVSKYAYTNSGASAEQIVVVEAANNQAAEEVKAALQTKLQEDIEQNRDYLPNEIPKLEKPVLKVVGNYVFLCVSEDNSKVEAVINSLE